MLGLEETSMSQITLEQLVDRVERLENRLTALEGERAPQWSSAPPIVAPPTVVGTPPPASRMPTDADTEYFVGAKVLPRAGAAVLILGIGYLVSLAVARGLIGPWTIFAGACLLCLGFVFLGQRSRDERESYGEILTAIGSCGLYLTFAAGLVFQNLYRAEVAIALFLGLSVVNLFYSGWRASRVFLAIGIVGGFVAALTPMLDRAFSTTAVLHVTVLAAAATVAGRHRWSGAILGVATAAFVAALAVVGAPGSGWYGVGLLYVSSVAAVLAWSRVRAEDERGVPAALAGAFAFAGPAFAFLAKPGLPGTYHVLGGSALLGLVAIATMRRLEARAWVGLGAALAATTVAPLGLAPIPSLFTYPGLAVVAVVAGIYGFRSVVALGAATLIAGLLRYAALWLMSPPTHTQDCAYLVVFALAAAGLGLAVRDREAEVAGTGVALFVVTRLAFLWLTVNVGMAANEAMTVVMILGSLLYLAIGFLRELAPLRYASFVGLGATVLKVLTIDLAETDPAVRVLLLMGLGLTMLGGGYGYIRHRRTHEGTEVRP
jgi:hypothetical protein